MSNYETDYKKSHSSHIKELWVNNIRQDQFFSRILGVQVMDILVLF